MTKTQPSVHTVNYLQMKEITSLIESWGMLNTCQYPWYNINHNSHNHSHSENVAEGMENIPFTLNLTIRLCSSVVSRELTF